MYVKIDNWKLAWQHNSNFILSAHNTGINQIKQFLQESVINKKPLKSTDISKLNTTLSIKCGNHQHQPG